MRLFPLLLLLVWLPACLIGPDKAAPDPPLADPDGRTVRVGYIANGLPAGIGFVLEEGQLFASQRLAVSFQRFGGPEGMRRALAANELDLALGLPTLSAAKLLEEDHQVVVVAGLQLAEEQVIVPVSSTVQSLADLKGKLVGSPGPGSSGDLLLWGAIGAAGMDQADIRTTHGTETQLVLLLESGKVDAAVLRGLTIAGLPNAERYRLLGDLAVDWRTAAKFDAPPVVGTVTMRRGFVDGYPDEAARALAAVILGARWGREHQSEVAGLMVRHLRMTQVNAQNYARRWSLVWTVAMDEATVGTMQFGLEQFRAQGLLRDPAPEALFDRALFVRSAQLAR